MSLESRIMRTVRVRNIQEHGVLANLLNSIAQAGGSVGTISLLWEAHHNVERDIAIYADDEAQLEKILAAMAANQGTQILEIRDQVLEMHQLGKIAVRSRFMIDSPATLRRVYTPGVAEVCMKIAKDPSLARRYTAICHLVAIVTDGTAILGLGDIGPVAGMPVMEGKAMLMETLVGLSGMPILLNTKDSKEIVDTVAAIAPTFAAIQLEDISAPRCFDIEANLQKRLDIPVMHDDQHGTAVVVTAALTSICYNVRTNLTKATIGQIGLGAAGMATGKMLMEVTGKPVMGADISEKALERFKETGGIPATLEEIMAKADIVIGTTGCPGLIKPEMVRKGQIILALSNPNPEIKPDDAANAGAACATDGRSVNNILGFPGILRGVVDVQAPYISPEMYQAAAEAISGLTPSGEIIPDPLDKKVHRAVAAAVAKKAIEQGLARSEYVPYVD